MVRQLELTLNELRQIVDILSPILWEEALIDLDLVADGNRNDLVQTIRVSLDQLEQHEYIPPWVPRTKGKDKPAVFGPASGGGGGGGGPYGGGKDQGEVKGMAASIGPSTAVSAYSTASEHAMDLGTMWRRGQRFLARYQADDNMNTEISERRIYTIHFSAGPGMVQVSDDAGAVCILFTSRLHHFEWLP
jgi:hypothetical protein